MTEYERPLCPKCHLPIRDDQRSITHLGKTYHSGCAPAPESAGDKDEPYPDRIGI
ncbi:MAG: hypothetical protein ACRD01_13270 [Terriglobales bacterium]